MGKCFNETVNAATCILFAIGFGCVIFSTKTGSRAVVEDVRNYSFGSVFKIGIIQTGEICGVEGPQGTYSIGDLVYLHKCSPVDSEQLAYEMKLGAVLILMGMIGCLITWRLDKLASTKKKH